MERKGRLSPVSGAGRLLCRWLLVAVTGSCVGDRACVGRTAGRLAWGDRCGPSGCSLTCLLWHRLLSVPCMQSIPTRSSPTWTSGPWPCKASVWCQEFVSLQGGRSLVFELQPPLTRHRPAHVRAPWSGSKSVVCDVIVGATPPFHLCAERAAGLLRLVLDRPGVICLSVCLLGLPLFWVFNNSSCHAGCPRASASCPCGCPVGLSQW